ncbi:hypothetical protein FRC01_007229 [Tulasnella sp. 417]|nr:hypothetical protein FRC01_007229 [Tulasnella sp. 417]
MLAELPTELKINILEHVDKTLPAVLRTNSTFRGITEPILYSVVTLAPFLNNAKLYKIVIECFRTMVARPSAAAAVRRLYVCLHCDTNHDPVTIGQVYGAFVDALAKLENLERLELPFWDDRYYQYPIGLPRGSPLQSLQHYYGPPEVIDNIQSNVLATLRIKTCGPKAVEVSGALLAAARYNAIALRALGIGREEHDDDEKWLEFIPQIPLLFPNIRFLDLGNWPTIDNDLIDRLIPSLALMENLRLLKLEGGWGTGQEWERPYVKRLHEGCPHLRKISFGDGEWRFAEEVREWAPPPCAWEDDPRTDEIWSKNNHQYLVDPQMDGFDYEFIKYWM